jgi:hypothetical protein
LLLVNAPAFYSWPLTFAPWPKAVEEIYIRWLDARFLVFLVFIALSMFFGNLGHRVIGSAD